MPDSFHASFKAALAGDAAALTPWVDPQPAEAGLSVHRNTIAKALADALVAQFPTVAQVVGREWLTAAALAYAALAPPRRASLADYGDSFASWLGGFPPAAAMPCLQGLAQLDWLSTCADLAADAPALETSRLATLSAGDFAAHALVLHPATRFAAFGDSTPSLWLALQAPGDAALELGDAAEGLAFVRRGVVQRQLLLSPGGNAFLKAVERGESLAAAAAEALVAEPALELSAVFAELVVAGAFTALRALS